MTDAAIGHNSAISKEASDRLKSFVDRVENLEEQKKSFSDDLRDVYAEAKGQGFDVKALKRTIKTRKLQAEIVQAETIIFETYCRALGMKNYLE